MRCDWCQQQIQGRYLRYESGEICCTACKSRLPACRLCGMPVKDGGEICSACAPRAVRCGVCEELIVGKYYQHDEVKALCTRCHERLPKCARCGRAFIEGCTEHGQAFCAECAREGERCGLCGRICSGRFWSHPAVGPVCAECHDHAQRCCRCGAPVRHGRTVDGNEGGEKQLLCEGCWDEVERCFGCGVPLVGRYFTHDRAPDRKFCERCMGRRDKCDFCSLPVDAMGHTYPDGRLSCGACRATAVLDRDELAMLEQQARTWLREKGGLQLRSTEECPVHLVDAHKIAELQRKRFVATPGFDRRERGLFRGHVWQRMRGDRVVSREEQLAIYIESGLPRNDAFGTLVHELVHLWQLDHFPREREVDPRYVEGLACWLQHRALLDRGAEAEARTLAESPDPIYGGGLRLVMEIEQRYGAEQTVAEVLRRL
jgi:hypothetical protein